MERPTVRLGNLSQFPPEVRQVMYEQLRQKSPFVAVEYSPEAREALQRMLQSDEQTSSVGERGRGGSNTLPRKKCPHDEIEDLMFVFLESLRKCGLTSAELVLRGIGSESTQSRVLDQNELTQKESDVSTLTSGSAEVSILNGESVNRLFLENSQTTSSFAGTGEVITNPVRPSRVTGKSTVSLGKKNLEPVLSSVSKDPSAKAPKPTKLNSAEAAVPLNPLRNPKAKQPNAATRETSTVSAPSGKQHDAVSSRRKRFLRTQNTRDESQSESSEEEEELNGDTLILDYEPESPAHEPVEVDLSTDDQNVEPNECEMEVCNEQNVGISVLDYGTDVYDSSSAERDTPRADLLIADHSDDEPLCLAFIGGCCTSGDECNLPHVIELSGIVDAARHYLQSEDLKSMKKLIRNLIRLTSPVNMDRSSGQVVDLVRIAARCFLKEKDCYTTLCMLLSHKFPCVLDVCEQLLALPECGEELPMIKELFKRLKTVSGSIESSSLQLVLTRYAESGSLGKAVQFLDAALKLRPEFSPSAETCARFRQLLGRLIEEEPNVDISTALDNLAPGLQGTTKEFLRKLLPTAPARLQASRRMAQLRELLTQENYAQVAENFVRGRYPPAEFVQVVSTHVVREIPQAFCGVFSEIVRLNDGVASLDRTLLAALNCLVLKCLELFLSPTQFDKAAMVVLVATANSLLDWVRLEDCSPLLLLFSAEICVREKDAEHHRFFLQRFAELKSRGVVDPSLYPLERNIALKCGESSD